MTEKLVYFDPANPRNMTERDFSFDKADVAQRPLVCIITEMLNCHRTHELWIPDGTIGDYLWCDTCEEYIFIIEREDK
jgi:hypothetical protein